MTRQWKNALGAIKVPSAIGAGTLGPAESGNPVVLSHLKLPSFTTVGALGESVSLQLDHGSQMFRRGPPGAAVCIWYVADMRLILN